VELLLQEREAHRVRRDDGLGVLDQVTELAVAVLTERRVQRDGLAAVLLDLDHLLRGHVQLLGELLRGRLTAEVLEHLPLHARKLVDDLDHVHRDTDGARLVGHRAGDGLADPPRRVGRELVALGVVELLDRTDQAKVAFLDQVEEQHPATRVALRQRDDQAEVGLQQVVLGTASVTGDPLELTSALRVELEPGVESLLGEQASLDPLGELDLLLGVEQGDLADLLEVVLDRVGSRSGCDDLLRGSVVVVGVRVGESAGVLSLVGDRLAVLGVDSHVVDGNVVDDHLVDDHLDGRDLVVSGVDVVDVDRAVGAVPLVGVCGGRLRLRAGGRRRRARRSLAGRGLLLRRRRVGDSRRARRTPRGGGSHLGDDGDRLVDRDPGSREASEHRLESLGVLDLGGLACGAERGCVDAAVGATAPYELLECRVLELARESGAGGEGGHKQPFGRTRPDVFHSGRPILYRPAGVTQGHWTR